LGIATLLVFSVGSRTAAGQVLNENFDDITTLPAAGWNIQNHSAPVGTTTWFQGNTAVFPPFSTTGYIGANFNNTGATGTISNWLLTPNRTFHNGDSVRFWTRTVDTAPFPDRLEVRLSTNGASTNVGTLSTDVGDFTTLLLSVNPNLITGPGTGPDGYPDTWTPFTITLSGLPAGGASGRIAFRYFVPGGGANGANSDYIGIDQFSYLPATTAAGVTVSGRILGVDGRGLSGAVVTLTGINGTTRTATTSTRGSFGFDDVEAGGDYVISVQSRRYQYDAMTIHVTDSLSNLVFAPAVANGAKSQR